MKALPQPSKSYGETVCCAGITEDGVWKRLFPIRYRDLTGDQSFGRWDEVEFKYKLPTTDRRDESCHVFEDTIVVKSKSGPTKSKIRLLNRMIVGSGKEAASLGKSLALIRPTNTRFVWRKKSRAKIDQEREAYKYAAGQIRMFDMKLAEIEPTPWEFRFHFEDENGQHKYQNGDWEAHAMYWRETKQRGEEAALKWLDQVFNQEYPEKGMTFAIGNMAKRPQTWQLLGVIRLDELAQSELPL